MPEGDTIHRLASRLAPMLVDREVTAFSARRIPDDAARALVHRRIVSVEARGKNLLVRFDNGSVLHIHLRMAGRIEIERRRSAFWTARMSTPDMRLAVASGAVVGHRLPVCRLLSETQEKRDLGRLGPDLVREDFDEDEAVRRLRALGAREIGDALMVQSAACGIGNVYKSEVLFLEALDPRTRLARVDDASLRSVLRRASTLLRRNLGHGPRRTREALRGTPLWVYGRGGRPCLRCETPIRRFMQGPAPGRSTYVCPQCQAPAAIGPRP